MRIRERERCKARIIRPYNLEFVLDRDEVVRALIRPAIPTLIDV